MLFLIIVLIVICSVPHAFRGTNPVAFAADIFAVLFLMYLLGGC